MGRALKLAFVLVLLGACGRGKIPIVYQTGQDTFESGVLPAPYDKEPALVGAYAGYVCDVTGVFWSYFSISNCRAAAIRGNQFDDSAELAAVIKAKYPDPVIPFWADHGWELIAGAVVLLVALGLIFGRRKKTALRHSVPPKTQFHLAVNPDVAGDHRAAWERPSQPQTPQHQHPPQPQYQYQQHQQHQHPQPRQHPPTPPPPPAYGAVLEPPTSQYPAGFNPQQYAQQQQPMMMPPVAARPATSQHTQIGYIVPPAVRAGHTPRPEPQPSPPQPTVTVAPHAYNPAAQVEDGPTVFDTRAQANAEQHYQHYQQRAVRGSYVPEQYPPPEASQTAPMQTPAVRAAQLPTPTVVARPRNK